MGTRKRGGLLAGWLLVFRMEAGAETATEADLQATAHCVLHRGEVPTPSAEYVSHLFWILAVMAGTALAMAGTPVLGRTTGLTEGKHGDGLKPSQSGRNA